MIRRASCQSESDSWTWLGRHRSEAAASAGRFASGAGCDDICRDEVTYCNAVLFA